MGLTTAGFTRRTYDDILTAKIEKAVELFGSDIDTSEQTPLGKFIRIGAYDQSIAEEEIESLYYSIFPQTATGVNLERLCMFVGITRIPATAARFTATITGAAGTVIPYGFIVSTESKITFYNTAEVTIAAGGTVDITVDCEKTGIIGNVSPSDINEVTNPIGEMTVLGSALVLSGAEEETDVALRKRFEHARDGAGSSNENAIKAALLRVPTVTSAGVVVNDTNAEDTDGRPAHSFECYVAGGNDYHAQIAEIIFEKKPIGIATYGTETVEITDDSGTTHDIKFSHTSAVTVYVKASIRTDSTFEGTNGITAVQNNIMSYINGLLLDDDVVLSSLYGKIHAVTGVTEVTELELSTNGTTWATDNVSISQWQKAQCSTVTVTEVT